MHKENLLKPQESDVGEEMDGVDATTLEAHEQQGLPTVKDVIWTCRDIRPKHSM